ncbi:uncharacterized protein N7458_012321 [Penicillium daleae]|uniref:Uncharacterized protein n=1 Tax=Penicillium daleae TaxID=63821 RepID=A0AAD6BWD1_9EURO|nr:uncharacterized protein N7458_012321 [Penicillium daleae]KAJ5433165.1 hypothetical protein N7458_012321 [Penicillium daleae]
MERGEELEARREDGKKMGRTEMGRRSYSAGSRGRPADKASKSDKAYRLWTNPIKMKQMILYDPIEDWE